ncbi:esterase/lipase family protein [Aldersonia kunmingensis]|uniref:esterase/lipase family protein n=1 Tax=Aldersonia kunmingensis TaxID=408066 RepID=UPI000A03D831|nr:alpha/beta fold hydrolase [Aldersonia kunmingensis]
MGNWFSYASRPRRSIAVVGTIVAAVLGAGLVGPPAAVADEYGPRQPDWAPAVAYSMQHPGSLPIGMNDPGCRPGSAHPRPVVLLNGAFLNKYATWSKYSPELTVMGFCVFGLDYGGPVDGPFHQMGDLRDSAREIGEFVDEVLRKTGAKQVDLVGYSEGGLVPFYFLNVLGGADRVGTLVSLASPVRGMSGYRLLDGIASLPGGTANLDRMLPAAVDGTAGSDFVTEIARGGQTRTGVRYVTVSSRTDLVVAPGEALLADAPNVTNVVLQDACPQNRAFHGSMTYDDTALRLVSNALDPTTATAPDCHGAPSQP